MKKALIFIDWSEGKTTYLGYVEDDYQQPKDTRMGYFMVAEVVDDSLRDYTNVILLKVGDDLRYHISSRQEVTLLDNPFQTFSILRTYNKELHRLYDEPEAVARFNHVLEGLKVSPMNFLQYVLDNPEQK